MRTVEERAQDFVSRGEYSPTLKECYIAGAAEEHILLTEWSSIKEDMLGMCSDRMYEELVESLPILVKEIDTGEIYAINRTEIADWSGDLCHHPRRYVWRKIHE